MVIDVEPAPAEELEHDEVGEEDLEVAPRNRRTGPPAPKLTSVVLSLVMLGSVIALFFGAFAYGLSGLQEQRSQHQLYSELRGLLSPASPIAPFIGGRIPDGSPVALLTSPQAGLHDAVIVQGTSSGALLAGPGHLPTSPLPGQAGAAVVLGKSTTAGAPFGELARLRRGDVITVRTGQGPFRYVVQGRLVNGGRLPRVPSTSGFLLLGTSGGEAPGGFTPSHVVYTYAKLQGHAAPIPRRQPRSVPRSDLAGHGDPGAWPFVALWSAVLIIGTAACWRLWSYWGLFRTWLVGAPVLFAVLWALSDEALRLLPNVY
jgi:sortase A